ncbi:DAPG hydrolase family protein [Williamsia phyllosphaerae]|uniref:DAPG hydrolase PhiG domain-containing protein n=1 Tax=Williamsia phyllosphaerae TaxID=885042 RepID=A0ABQ1UEB6_9NOCA|nr:hypothetical protein [Williamsia phyllosphaerae]GGF17047.1 hypothetical protein GCM10007298_11350 [Williamsia phyllosphaerae]
MLSNRTRGVRYVGYRDADRALPFAKYMAAHTDPAPAPVRRAFDSPPLAPLSIPDFANITRDLRPAGYSTIETGYGRRPDGVLFVAVRTEMPRVTAAMWDWWFGWHSVCSARYKLWHPDAHEYASVRDDRTTAAIPDRQKYVGNTSYVDELVGPKLQQLGIDFRDPRRQGFTIPSDQTIVFGRVGSSIAPIDLGWLAHQVRPVPGGAEMRSRFYLNMRGLHRPDLRQAARAMRRGASVDPTDLFLGLDVARDLLMHCGQEMNHLAGFLPELHREFAARP